jgi:transcriptional regulator with XRE-family HTH domain
MELHVNKKVRQELGIAIRRRRHKLNLSQEDFADEAGVHRTYISSIELGKVDISINIAYKIACALKIPLSSLLKEVENNI